MQSRKTRSKFGIQGNFYPVTTSAFLEDERNRITLLTTEAHGVASLASGECNESYKHSFIEQFIVQKRY